jgi:hypothetical protein
VGGACFICLASTTGREHSSRRGPFHSCFAASFPGSTSSAGRGLWPIPWRPCSQP